MTRKAIEFSVICLFLCFTAFAGPNRNVSSTKISVREYIKQWSPVAQQNMTKYRIPASIILAQGILESGYGNSRMARMANNHFGIKCLGWKGEGYYQQSSQKSCYRKYRDSEECFKDHARIISSKERYSFLFDLDITDYRGWARGLRKAGYAENAQYDRLLIRTIEEYKLYTIDRQVAKGPVKTYPAKSKLETVKSEAVKQPVPVLDLPEREDPVELIDRLAKDVIIQVDNSGELIEEEKIVVAPLVEDLSVNEPVADGAETQLKYVVVQEGESLESIAQLNGVSTEKLRAYNDLEADKSILSGSVIYLEEKNNRHEKLDMCTLRPGQGLWEVSQRYGIRLHALERMNHLRKGENLVSGMSIRLR